MTPSTVTRPARARAAPALREQKPSLERTRERPGMGALNGGLGGLANAGLRIWQGVEES